MRYVKALGATVLAWMVLCGLLLHLPVSGPTAAIVASVVVAAVWGVIIYCEFGAREWSRPWRYLKALRWAVLAGLLTGGLLLWIPRVSGTFVLVVAAVVAVIAFGAVIYYETKIKETGNALLYYTLIDDRLKPGLACLDGGESERAKAFFERVIKREPECADAYFGRGLVYHELEQYQEAIADFDRAIKLDPEHPYAHFQRGFVYHQREQYEQAVADFTRAIEIRPGEWALMLRAAAHNHLGQAELAQADYDRVAETAPRARFL